MTLPSEINLRHAMASTYANPGGGDNVTIDAYSIGKAAKTVVLEMSAASLPKFNGQGNSFNR